MNIPAVRQDRLDHYPLAWEATEFRRADGAVLDSILLFETPDTIMSIGTSATDPSRWLLSVDQENIGLFDTVETAKVAAAERYLSQEARKMDFLLVKSIEGSRYYLLSDEDDFQRDIAYGGEGHGLGLTLDQVVESLESAMNLSRNLRAPGPDDVLIWSYPVNDPYVEVGERTWTFVSPDDVDDTLQRMTRRGERPEVASREDRDRVLTNFIEDLNDMTEEDFAELP